MRPGDRDLMVIDEKQITSCFQSEGLHSNLSDPMGVCTEIRDENSIIIDSANSHTQGFDVFMVLMVITQCCSWELGEKQTYTCSSLFYNANSHTI